MPVYTCKCIACGKEADYYTSVSDRNNTPNCDCGAQTEKIISAYCVIPDLVPYLDENIGKEPTWVKSKQHRKQLMKEHGVIEKYGKGWR